VFEETVPRVRILISPPHSLKCGEIRLVIPRKSREIRANSLVFIVKRDRRKCSVLALHRDTLPVFSDQQVSSPVSATPVGE
jgi:hypothetical protein